MNRDEMCMKLLNNMRSIYEMCIYLN